MASKARQTSHSVAAQALQNALRDAPEAFEFFDALRRLECAAADRPRFGESTKASEDSVRFRQRPSLAFAPRMLDAFQPGGGAKPAQLYGLFFGLFGPNGPLPLHLTEYAIDRQINHRDRTLAAFADMFHHRMISLFYRAWADAQPTVQADRPDEDRFGLYMNALVGLAGKHTQQRDALPDQFKRYFAGRLLQQSRGVEGLKRLLDEFFRIPVTIIECVSEWMRLPESAIMRMGLSAETGSLGRTAVIGEYVHGAQQRFRLRLGPLSMTQFNNFLPGGRALEQLVAAVKTYVGEEMAWDVQLILNGEQIPATKLGKAGRLGLTTWMAPPSLAMDADDVILRPVG